MPADKPSVSQFSGLALPAPFDALTGVGRAALHDAATWRTFSRGELALDSGATADRVVLLLSGEVVERDAGTATRVLRGPEVIGLSSVIAEAPARELTARGSVDLLSIPAATLGELQKSDAVFARAVATALAREVEGHAIGDRARAQRENVGPFIDEAGWSPPGPYVTAEHDVFAFFVKDEPTRIAARLPPGLRPLPVLADTWFLVFHAGVRKYPERSGAGSVPTVCEASILVPCLGPMLRPALYIPSMYTEGLFSLLSSREVHGLPARHARVEKRAQSFDLFAHGEVLASASWQAHAPLDLASSVASWIGKPLARFGGLLNLGWSQLRAFGIAGPQAALSSVPLFVHRKRAREVSKVASGADAWAVDQLVQVPLHLSKLENLRALGEPKVTLTHAIDGLQGTCTSGISARIALSWGAARDRVDYKKR